MKFEVKIILKKLTKISNHLLQSIFQFSLKFIKSSPKDFFFLKKKNGIFESYQAISL